MLIQLQDGQPIGHPIMESNFRQLFPNTSFSKYLTPEDVENFGYGLYDFSESPNPGKYEKVVETNPTKDERGVWMQAWKVVPMSDSEKKEANDRAAEGVRSQRNLLLQETDWIVVKAKETGTNLSAEFKAYRQALRDITEQEGFPHIVTWPERP